MKKSLVLFSLLLFFVLESWGQLTPQEIQRRTAEKLADQYSSTPNQGGGRGGAPEQECNNALAVCQGTFNQPSAYSGYGATQEVPLSSCLGSQEKNSVWYIFTVQTPGTLNFVIDPNTNSDDYDFALYNLTNRTCADIATGAAPEVRCNFCVTSGNTGLSTAGTNASEPASNCNVYSTILNVTAGQTYVLIVSNYTSSNDGYSLTFGGTANIFDNSPPLPASATTPCGSNIMNVQISEAVLCSSIAANGSDFTLTGPGGPFTITAASGINCGNATSQLTLTFSPPVAIGSNYVLTVNTGTDGNTLIDNCGNALAPGSVFNFTATPPPASISGPATVCKGSPATLSASFGTGYNWNTGATTQNITINPLVNTTYSVTVTSGSCTQNASHTVTVQASPTANFTYTPNPICAGQSVQFTSTSILLMSCFPLGTPCTSSANCFPFPCLPGVSIYSWDFDDGSLISLTQNPTHTFSTPGTYDVSLTVNDVTGGCSNKITIPITVLPASGPITVSNDVTICQGASANLTASGGGSYSWTSNPPGFTSTSATINVSPTATTTYTVSSPGCSGTQTRSVIVTVTSASITVTPSSASACPGVAVPISASGAGNYTWSPAGGLNTTSGAAVLATPASTITYTVTGTTGSCTATSTVTVTIFPTPNPVITPNGPLTFCAGGSVTLDAGSGFFSYLWSDGASTQTIVVNQSGTFSVIVTDNNNCTATSPIVFTVLGSSLNPVITGPASFCTGGSIVLDAGIGYTSYQWSGGETTRTITVNQAGSFTVSVSDGTCSGVSLPHVVTVSTALNPGITPTGQNIICQGSTIDLDAGTGYNTYIWSNGATDQIITVNQTGSYDVSVTDLSGCAGTSQPVGVVVVNNPAPVITGPITFCTGGSSTLDAGTGFSTYLWSDGATTTTIIVNATGTFTVTVTDNNSCTGISAPFTTTLSTSLTPVITGPTSFCQGQSVNLNAGTGYLTYSWSSGETTPTITVNTAGSFDVSVTDATCSGTSQPVVVTEFPNPVPILAINGPLTFCQGSSVGISTTNSYTTYLWSSGETTSSITVTQSGNYSVQVTDANGCSAGTAPETVTVILALVPTITADGPVSFCQGGSVELDAGSGYNSYLWNTGATTQLIITTQTGTFDVTVSDADGCTGLDDILIEVFSLPAIDYSDTCLAKNGEIEILVSGGTPPFTIKINDEIVTGTIAGNLSSGDYVISVTDFSGCTDTKMLEIKCIVDEYENWVPNAFTPNGDGRNDYITLLGDQDKIKSYELMIFNRWGQKIYFTNDLSIISNTTGTTHGWDGTFKGVTLEIGTYTYYARVEYITGERKGLKGSIALIR